MRIGARNPYGKVVVTMATTKVLMHLMTVAPLKHALLGKNDKRIRSWELQRTFVNACPDVLYGAPVPYMICDALVVAIWSLLHL